MIPNEAVMAAADVLRDEGGRPGHDIHSWRCGFPGRYGPCDCVEVTARLMIEAAEPKMVTGETSDGFHTFNELYRYRLLYNAALFNSWNDAWGSGAYETHKSWRHSDGEECFGGGWFIVVAQLPTGQISNHYEAKDWGLFGIPERDQAEEWDGHTPAEAAARLELFIQQHGG